MSTTDIWNHQINTEDLNTSFPEILQQVCNNLHYVLLNDHNKDIENTHIHITYKIHRKKKSKRNKLKNLPKYKKIKKTEENKTCAICLSNFQENKYKRNMPNCCHEFHKKCIDHWLYQDNKFSCPVCRTFQGFSN
jgi:hypothetical protein